MRIQKDSRKTNGHAGPNGRPNGRSSASRGRGGIPASACSGKHRDRAASDDANGTAVASATASPAAASLQMQASTGREAYAEVATSCPNGEASTAFPVHPGALKNIDQEDGIPPGEHPLPADPAEFVEAIHAKADFTEVWCQLLCSKDDKIKQRAAEKLTEMRYRGATSFADEPSQIVIDIDSAVARRAAEGAKK